jgi:hypothetical protein
MRGAHRLAFVIGLALLGGAATAQAQQPREGPGDTAWALPGVARVGVATPGPKRLSVSARGGYGWTEEQTGEGSHHRLFGRLGIGVRPTEWLGLALRLDGRYDRHPDDAMGSDDGWVGDPRLAVRAGFEPTEGLGLGAEINAWFPGRDAPSIEFAATTLETLAMLSYTYTGGATVATELGFRFDQSHKSVDQPGRLRQGDRIALGVSEFNAVLVGLGATYRTGPVELLGEFTWDVLVGSGSPSAGDSPMHVTAGVRYFASKRIQVGVNADVMPGGRPAVGPMDPLVPIQPRVAVSANFTYRLPFEEPSAETEEPEPEPETRTLDGQVVDSERRAVEGATVTLEVGEGPEQKTRSTQTDAQGQYRFEEVPQERVRLRIQAEDFGEKVLEVGPRGSPPQESQLERLTPMGELRGLIRSFSGKALSATIEITPKGQGDEKQSETNDEGRFEIELEEGNYKVEITADGYRTQTRTVQIEENGVTVLNAELRRD